MSIWDLIVTYLDGKLKDIALIGTSVFAIWGMISDKRKEWILSPFKRNQDIAESKAATAESNAAVSNADMSVKEQTYNLITTLEEKLNELHLKVIGLQEEVVVLNSQKGNAEIEVLEWMNKTKNLFNRMLSLCDSMCGESEKCKEQVNKLKKDFEFLTDESNDGGTKIT